LINDKWLLKNLEMNVLQSHRKELVLQNANIAPVEKLWEFCVFNAISQLLTSLPLSSMMSFALQKDCEI
jgi:hypothetical protein